MDKYLCQQNGLLDGRWGLHFDLLGQVAADHAERVPVRGFVAPDVLPVLCQVNLQLFVGRRERLLLGCDSKEILVHERERLYDPRIARRDGAQLFA